MEATERTANLLATLIADEDLRQRLIAGDCDTLAKLNLSFEQIYEAGQNSQPVVACTTTTFSCLSTDCTGCAPTTQTTGFNN
jgi:hypothetical protein